MGVIMTFCTFLLMERLIVGREILTCYSVDLNSNSSLLTILGGILAAEAGTAALFGSSGQLLPRGVGRGCLLLRVRSALLARWTASVLAVGASAIAIGNLMVVHSHELIDQVTKLGRIIDLVTPSAAHRALFVIELLLQYYTRSLSGPYLS